MMQLQVYDQNPMTKHFCDFCKKQFPDIDQFVSVGYRGLFSRKEYCYDCFQNQKNWELIHKIKVNKAR